MTISEIKAEEYKKLASIIPIGRDNAISLREVVTYLDTNDRAVKNLIFDAVVEEGMCIAGDDNGYYIPEDEIEFRNHCHLLKSRASATNRRYLAMMKHSNEYGGVD